MRLATPADAETILAQTRAGMGRYAEFAPPGWSLRRVDADQHRARIQATLENPDAVVLVAELGHVAWRPEHGRAHLLGLFVEPEAWGTGLAKELLDRAVETMRERGFTEASLYTPAGQARARRFYEREGWQRAGDPFFADPFGLDLVEYRRELGVAS